MPEAEAALPLTLPPRTSAFPPPFPPLLRDQFLLFALGLSALTLLQIFGQFPPQNGLAPYYREVASHTGSASALLLYAAKISLLAAALESLLRLLQSKAESRWGPRTAVILAALLYAITHLKFHLPGALYALLLGLGTATFFHRTRRWLSLVLWHVAWDLAAIAFTILSALYTDGPARHAVLFEYKQDQIEAGQLSYAEGWGWIDKNHFPADKITALTAHLQSHRGQTTTWKTEEGFSSLATFPNKHTHTYTIRVPENATPAECHAAASAIYLRSAQHSESLQNSQPLHHGTHLSAYAFDDLPSTLAAAYATQPTIHPPLTFTYDKSQTRTLWQLQAATQIPKKIHTPADCTPPDPKFASSLKSLLTQIQKTTPWFTPDP